MTNFKPDLQASIRARRKKHPNETVKQSYGFVRRKLSKVMKDYEWSMLEAVNMAGGEIMDPRQKPLFDSLEYVRKVTTEIILQLDNMETEGWIP